MKLISHVTLRLSIAITVIMSAWAVLFYLAMIDEINDETDDSLEDYSEAIIIRALAGEKLPSKNNGSNNQYYMTRVDDQYAQTHPSIEYSDEMVYIEEKRETEPARILKTIFQNDQDEHFLLVVMTPTIEKRDLKHSIFIWMSILYATLLIIIIVLNICVFYYSMKPLYRLLGWLRDYHVGQRNKPLDNKNSITEFRTLYDATNLFAARNEKLFEQQKRFIGNASHELQTPLAICRNRLEMMMEDESVSERQLEELAKTHHTLEHITKLNKSLLLLSKIENEQFPETRPVCLNDILTRYLEDYKEVYDYRDITVEVNEEQRLTPNERDACYHAGDQLAEERLRAQRGRRTHLHHVCQRGFPHLQHRLAPAARRTQNLRTVLQRQQARRLHRSGSLPRRRHLQAVGPCRQLCFPRRHALLLHPREAIAQLKAPANRHVHRMAEDVQCFFMTILIPTETSAHKKAVLPKRLFPKDGFLML